MSGPGAYFIGDEEKKEVMDVLESKYLSRYGDDNDPAFKAKVRDYERKIIQTLGVKHSVAVNSGTSALMACLFAMGIGPGDEVIVPGYTFIASMSAIIALGAKPILAEIDESLSIDPQSIKEKLSDYTKAILPVHMLGNPCQMDEIMQIAHEFDLLVLEDACQAFGGSYKGKRLGTIGTMGAFSSNIYKVINTGDGGALVTNDQRLYERAFGYHDQGHKPMRHGSEVGSRDMIGINMRMNELTGAFALGQVSKLDLILNTLRQKKALFKNTIKTAKIPHMKFRVINDPEECCTLCVVIFDSKELAQEASQALNSCTMENSGWHVYNNMENFLEYCKTNGIEANKKHCLPKTDDILSRSVNMSIGVVDKGIGTHFGINIKTSDDDVIEIAKQFIKLIKPIANKF